MALDLYREKINEIERDLFKRNIFYKTLDREMPLGREFWEFVRENKNLFIEANIQELLTINMLAIKRLILRTNQYVIFEGDLENKLKIINLKLLKSLLKLDSSSDEYELKSYKIISGYQLELIKILSQVEEIKALDKGLEFFDIVPCSNYSSEYQLKIMNIDISNIKEPILDIGCGYEGNLVAYLSGKNYRVKGIDRLVREDDNLLSLSWFQYEFPEASFGTIISHMAFTNHFKRENLKKEGDYISYGKKYMEILNSLKPGGSFFYTPAVEFIEELLPEDRFSIERHEIKNLSGNQDFTGVKITRNVLL